MNYLAHSFLSGADHELLIGNFIADAVKGKAMDDYSQVIRQGIVLHRAIDEFTDQHEMHRASRIKLHGRYGHYSGVIVDIYYDHFLAANWSSYSQQGLEAYTQWVYGVLQKNHALLPEKINYMLQYMIPQNWLLNYANFEGIGKVLKGLSNRAKFNSKMENGVDELREYYDEFEAEFSIFFPVLQSFVADKISETQ